MLDCYRCCTPLMVYVTPIQKLKVRQVEVRARLAEISALDDEGYTGEVEEEQTGLVAELRTLDQRVLAAELSAEPGTEPQQIATTDGDGDGDPARLELRSRCSVSNYVAAAIKGRAVVGAEAELADELNLDAGHIPLELWEPTPEMRAKELEMRAVAGPPGTVGVNLDSIRPRVFAPSVIPRLGVEMPRVPSGTYGNVTLTSEAAVDPEGKGDAIAGTAATFAVTTATPKRISARLELAIEDIAAVGISNYESALRENLSLSLSAELDNQGLNGDGQAPNLNGILNRLGDPTAPTATADFDAFVAAFADGIDGLWATMMSDVAIVAGVETYRLSAKTFRDASGQDLGSISFADYAAAHCGGWWTNKRMPDPASNDQHAILYRKGRSMIGGEGGIRTAVCPVWADSIGIDDIYSGSAKGERYVTFHVLLGDVILVQPDAYAQLTFQVA